MKVKNYLADASNLRFFLLLFVSCFILYFHTCNNDFVYDDVHLIINNAYIKHIRLIPRIFSVDFFHFSPLHAVNYYRPIPILTHALEYKIWRLNPFGYHLTNIVLHAFNCLLVYYLIFLLFNNNNLARLSSVLFCLHPIHNTTVSLIFNRSSLLLLFFGMAGIINYLLFTRSFKIKNYLLSIVCFSLAVFTKENAILLLPLLLLCLYSGSKNKVNLKYLLPFPVIYLLYLYIRLILLNIPFPRYQYLLYHFNPVLDAFNFLNILTHYLRLLISPVDLYFMHAVNAITVLSKASISAFIFWVLIGGLFLWAIKNNKRIIFWGIAWFGLSISYVIKAMHTFEISQLAMLEHWLYLPSIGFFLILGNTLYKLYRKIPKISIPLFICLFIFWSVLTVNQNSYGKNKPLFYKHILDNSPNNTYARYNLANVFLDLKNYDEAEKQFRIVLTTDPRAPDIPDVYLGLGNVYLARGDNLNGAIGWYKKALEYQPSFAEAWNNLGLVYTKQDKRKEAYAAFQKALLYNPGLAVAYANLGDWHMKKQEFRQAIGFYQKARYLDPDQINYILRLTNSYLKINDVERLDNILRGISDKYLLAEIYSRIGVDLAEKEIYPDALSAFNRALELDSQSRAALVNLGALYANMGDFNKAISVWQRANKIYPQDEEIKFNIQKAKQLLKYK